MVTELSRREKELGVKPDADIDVFMKVSTLKNDALFNLVNSFLMKNGAVLNLVISFFNEKQNVNC